ncbi:MAG: hypothetical protein K2J54_02530, partial [Clostridia bacterium]|nr:hypothetical protein [Clostridia bacterium]
VAFAGCNKSGSEGSGNQNEGVTSGTFYTLQQAYDNGYLTQADLESIAYYHNGEKPYPENISEDTAKSIKRDWAKNLTDDETNPTEDVTEDEVTIRKYYGTYNGCVAVTVERTGAMHPAVYNPVVVEIGTVVFNYGYYSPRITVWKMNGDSNQSGDVKIGTFYTLQQAYDNGYLTHEDLMTIANRHNNNIAVSLQEDISLLIRETAAYISRNDKNNPIYEAKAGDYAIIKYYGVYNGCYAVVLNSPYAEYPSVEIDKWETIDDVQIHYYNFYTIKIWKNIKGYYNGKKY